MLLEKILFKLNNLFWRFFLKLLQTSTYFKFFKETSGTQTPINIKNWFQQKVLGYNREAYWPVHPTSIVTGVKNIYVGIETSPGLMPGCYIQGIGKIYIGDYTQIAANVGIISANHDLHDNRLHLPKTIIIGKYCWIGMGAVILPGVELGDYTIVGAGAVVTKSFIEGYCIVAGNPAQKIKDLDKNSCIFHKSKFEYNGYIPAIEFDKFRKRNLNV